MPRFLFPSSFFNWTFYVTVKHQDEHIKNEWYILKFMDKQSSKIITCFIKPSFFNLLITAMPSRMMTVTIYINFILYVINIFIYTLQCSNLPSMLNVAWGTTVIYISQIFQAVVFLSRSWIQSKTISSNVFFYLNGSLLSKLLFFTSNEKSFKFFFILSQLKIHIIWT